MAANRCRQCNNLIRAGETYCYLHGGQTAAELDAGVARGPGAITLGEMDQLRARRRAARSTREWAMMSAAPLPMTAITPLDAVAEAYCHHLPVSVETTEAVLEATRDAVGKPIVDVPADAAQLRTRVADVARALESRIGVGRVQVIRMSGLARKTANRARMLSPQVTHDVLLVDAGTEHEVIVDPFIAALAPVRQEVARLPITQSKMQGVMSSPYVDAPWIGTRDEYRSNGYMEWTSAARAS